MSEVGARDKFGCGPARGGVRPCGGKEGASDQQTVAGGAAVSRLNVDVGVAGPEGSVVSRSRIERILRDR